MKHLIFLIGLLFISCLVNVQHVEAQNVKMDYTDTWRVDPLTAGDSIGKTDSIWTYNIRKYTDRKVYPNFRIALDKIGGTPCNVTVALKYKAWNAISWTTESTVTYHGTVDTAITIVGSTARTADFWQVFVKGATDEFHVVVDSVYMKFVY